MFKKLIVGLLIAAFCFIPSLVSAETCQVLKGTKMVVLIPDGNIRAVTMPHDADFDVKETITEEQATWLENNVPPGAGEWDGAKIGEFIYNCPEHGPEPLVVIIQQKNLIDCE